MEYVELNYCVTCEFVIAHKHLKHLWINRCNMDSLLVDAPNLLSFSYSYDFYDDCDILPSARATLIMPSLMSACLEIFFSTSERSDVLKSVTSILGSFSNVELLKLDLKYCNELKVCISYSH